MFLKEKRKKNKEKGGFTLIELMVASTIFIVVMVISIGAVLSIVDANRKAQSLNAVITNLNFAVESMVRDIREGDSYSLNPTCNATGITFNNSAGTAVTYSLGGNDDEQLTKTVDSKTSPLTAPEVVITNLNFCEVGSDDEPGQPLVLLLLQGRAGVNTKTQSTFQIETLINQRLLDSE